MKPRTAPVREHPMQIGTTVTLTINTAPLTRGPQQHHIHFTDKVVEAHRRSRGGALESRARSLGFRPDHHLRVG